MTFLSNDVSNSCKSGSVCWWPTDLLWTGRVGRRSSSRTTAAPTTTSGWCSTTPSLPQERLSGQSIVNLFKVARTKGCGVGRIFSTPTSSYLKNRLRLPTPSYLKNRLRFHQKTCDSRLRNPRFMLTSIFKIKQMGLKLKQIETLSSTNYVNTC